MSLMLHAGAHSVTRNQLADLPVPQALGSRHFIRPFADDVNLITDYLGAEGLTIVDEAYGVKNDAKGMPAQFFGAIEVRGRALEGEYIPASGYGLTIGVRGAYDQSLPRGLAIGSRVFVCDNLAFSGEINIATKQTLNIGSRLPGMLRAAVARIPAYAEHQQQRFDLYRNHELKPRIGDAALVEMVRRGVLNPSQVGKAIEEWDSPSHAEHAENGYSVWRLQQAVTEAIKPANRERNAIPATWNRTIAMTQFLDDIVGLTQQ